MGAREAVPDPRGVPTGVPNVTMGYTNSTIDDSGDPGVPGDEAVAVCCDLFATEGTVTLPPFFCCCEPARRSATSSSISQAD